MSDSPKMANGFPPSWLLTRRTEDVAVCFEGGSDDNTDRSSSDGTCFPCAGETWLGFSLVMELGRGAFGRVFLAQQAGLANRLVVLKVGTDLFEESQTLAQLQHSYIVPIYSAHKIGRLQALCMPYFGATTLADVLAQVASSQALPESGKVLVSTLHIRKSETHHAASSSIAVPAIAPSSRLAEQTAHKPARVRLDDVPLEKLSRLNYVEAVLWIVSRLASGLAHAHDRGIFHRDLKPANILLTDDGEPMLLDFNLSENSRLRSAAGARVGGTLPYMAPEHLEAFRGQGVVVDGRSDIFSLGVILCELLTVRHPFPTPSGSMHDVLPQMLADRRKRNDVRRWNKNVSAAVQSIVHHCLASDPADRYQSAHELKEDLQRQLGHLPLRHAPEPSLRERAGKWLRRHPRLASCFLVATLAACLVLPPMGLLALRERTRILHVQTTREAFQRASQAAQRSLNRRSPDRGELDDAIRQGRGAVGSYHVLDDPNWQDRPDFRYLSANEKQQRREELGELLLLMARAAIMQAGDTSREREELLRTALDWNERAEAIFGGNDFSSAGWRQRAELVGLLYGKERAKPLAEKARQTPLRTASDYFLLAGELMAERRFTEALTMLEEATEKDPRNFWAWFRKGACHYELLQDQDAIMCYRMALALWPDAYELYLGRALVYQRLGRRDRALADFNRAVSLRPDEPELYLNRAVLHGEMRQHARAIEDLNRALEKGYSPTRICLLRAVEREKSGDAAGAWADRERGLRSKPADAVDWAMRGWARMSSDPRAALGDFDEALKLNPRYLNALQNKAHILSEHLSRMQEALEVIDRLVELYPDFTPARVGRGVLRARAGRAEEARADAVASLKEARNPITLYQAANIYALTSPKFPVDREKALDLLVEALRGGFGLDVVESDPDFGPIRGTPEFKQVVAAARTLQSRRAKDTK